MNIFVLFNMPHPSQNGGLFYAALQADEGILCICVISCQSVGLGAKNGWFPIQLM